MPLTPYCTVTDMDYIWSSFGVGVRADDQSNPADPYDANAILAAVIENATADVNFYLLQAYTVAVIATSTWVKWCTATIACVKLAKRRGNPVPESMQDEFDRYMEQLEEIKDGDAGLPGDDGLAAPQFDNSAMVTNFQVDSRFGATVRRKPLVSTQSPQAPTRKGYDGVTPSTPWWF